MAKKILAVTGCPTGIAHTFMAEEALKTAAGCGTILLATAHGGGRDDLQRRALYRDLPELFQKLVLIHTTAGRRTYQVEELS